jgi:thermitase
MGMDWKKVFAVVVLIATIILANSAGVTSASLFYGNNMRFDEISAYGFVSTSDGSVELVIGVNESTPEAYSSLIDTIMKNHGKIVNTISTSERTIAVVVNITLNLTPSFIEEARKNKIAKYIEPNGIFKVQLVPNDPDWPKQWGPQKIEADWAWNTTTGNSTVLVAVIDTGIDYTHPDLAANYVPLGYDWANNDDNPMDDHGHGTHCAGIIAAVLNNAKGIAGIAQVRIMAEKAFNASGVGFEDDLAEAIIHAVDQGAKILSNSWGSDSDSELIRDAIKYAYSKDALIVAAAGNDGTNMKFYPAAYDEVIAVAATDQSDAKASFSNWGEWIELAAPGVSIYSTMPTYHVTLNDRGYSMNYSYMSGTSMACPHVVGVAALVWGVYQKRTRDWVRLWLRSTADDLGINGFDVMYGYGRINARKSFEQSPPEHELIAYDWTTPAYVEPEFPGTVNATIFNFGVNTETNVQVCLLANDTMVNATSIDLITSGNFTTVELTWVPKISGLYNVTLYVEPVPNEVNIDNNILWKYVYVGFPIKAVVLHSAGNIMEEIITNWKVLNNEWYLFGNTAIYIDYVTLNKGSITYEDINASGADVLIISCAYDPSLGWEFADSEIEAIKRYVQEGHGIIATAGTFYYEVPNNNKLASLFGLNDTITWDATLTDLLNIVNASHPLSLSIPNPLIFPLDDSVIPPDGVWDSNELAGGTYIALGKYFESAVVEWGGNVYISTWLETIPAYYRHHLQMLYNAIIWAFPHLAIFLSPTAGSVGMEIAVNGSKATANGTVSIYWDDMFIGNTTVNSVGDFSYTLTVPENATSGVHEIKAIDATTRRKGSKTFTVTLISTYPSEGPVGTKVTVEGIGFQPKSQVIVMFNGVLIGDAMVDSFGNFLFTFNIPLSTAGTQIINVLDAEGNRASATFTVTDDTPLNIQIDVGILHFLGEIAESYVQTTFQGQAVNATTITASLYKPDGTTESLAAQLLTTGLYKITYTILGNQTGTYTFIVSANYFTDTIRAKGTSIKSFLVSDTLTLMNKQVTEISDGIATVQTDLGFVTLNLTAMNVTLENIFLKVIAINGTTATIQTTLGIMNGTVTGSVSGDIATIVVPGLGQIQTDISNFKEVQEAWVIPQYVIILMALIAAASSTFSLVFLIRRKTT